MTTAAEVKKLVQPALARNDDLVLVKQALVIKPVTHIVRSILIDNMSGVGRFQPIWRVAPLCWPSEGLWGFGEWIFDLWSLDIPGIDHRLADRIEEITALLRPIQTILQFNEFALDYPFFPSAMRYNLRARVYIEAALGNLGVVDETLDIIKDRSKDYRPSVGSTEHFDELTGRFHDTVRAGDRIAVAAYLHKWEAYTVKNAKLEKFWQPSPFPIELEG